ncbi:DNA primase family protein [Sanguibacter sp. Z1732]|uniref:DNA primase family protein n=1 Tax=Sanguibacter sp. Z1732 TaxID=3435412 RepID=UPI003D9C93A3
MPPPTDGATALAAQEPDPEPAPPQRLPAPNEDNTALLLVDRHQHEIRHCSGRGTWLTWTGHRWSNDDNDHIHELIRTIARNLPEGEGWATYKKRALSYNGIRSIAGLARSDRRTVTPAEHLDAHPYELNTPTGVINLRTGELRPPDPAALHTRSTIIAPDFNQPTPMWDRFLADTFAGDPDMTTFIARAVGMSLIGQVRDQVFFFAFGSGANGKSTLMAVLQHIIGTGASGYAGTAPAEMLLATRNRGHPTELARLSGQRLVVTSELDDGQRFDEARIKELTGKDHITARFMRQDFFDFSPTHTLWLLANHQPQVRVGGMAFWRRVRMLPFVHTVPEHARIPDLEEQLIKNEGPGILAWAIRGAADYLDRGALHEPPAVLAATEDYEAGQNTVGRFVEDMCDVGDPNHQHMHIRSSQLRAAYESWCTEEGVEPVAPRSFTLALKSQFGVETTRTNAARYLDGIRLKDFEEASPEASLEDDEEAWWQR